MPRVKASDVLRQVQSLLGEPAGSYYDLRYRLDLADQAQVEMVQDTLSLSRELHIPMDGTSEFVMPDDFLTFAKETPYYQNTNGDRSNVKVRDPIWMQQYIQDWQAPHEGSPTYLVVDGGSRYIQVYPAPASGELVISYVPRPQELWHEDVEIFDGDPRLGRFATALAYKVASMELIARAPQQADMYTGMYEREVRKMRSTTRENTLRPQVAKRMRFYRSRG